MARKSRKVSRRSGGRRHRTRRGGYYGATGAIAPGAMEWGRGSEMGDWAVSSRGQNAIYGSSRKRRHTLRHVRRRRGGQDEEPAPVSNQPENTNPEKESENPTPPGGRRRKHTRRSGGRRHRKVKRGGDKYGAVSASYQGTGSRGMIDVVPTTTKYPTAGGPQYGAFNNHGAQPGSGFGSFVRAH